MRRLVICFDGTWNQVKRPEEVTNVVKFAQAVKTVASDGTSQVVYYNSGVGTGDLLDRFLGGVFGRGLEANVKRALAFLALNYEPGDEIYILGFSRGAYSARALGGVIGAAGVPEQAKFSHIERIWNYYRAKPGKRRKEELEGLAIKAPIRCVGVWDTVGSYGVPAGFGLGALARYVVAWTRGFRDSHLGTHVDIGLHALAVDEKRRPFAPTFWTWPKDKPASRSHIEQVWFAGAHANIGGSYPDCGISDLALIWMVARIGALGREKFQSALEFDIDCLANLRPDLNGQLYRSERGWPISTLWPFHRPVLWTDKALSPSVWWNGENADERHVNEAVHWSLVERHTAKIPPEYRPSNVRFPPAPTTIKTREEATILNAIRQRRRLESEGYFMRPVSLGSAAEWIRN
jgi:hypothetical protein